MRTEKYDKSLVINNSAKNIYTKNTNKINKVFIQSYESSLECANQFMKKCSNNKNDYWNTDSNENSIFSTRTQNKTNDWQKEELLFNRESRTPLNISESQKNDLNYYPIKNGTKSKIPENIKTLYKRGKIIKICIKEKATNKLRTSLKM